MRLTLELIAKYRAPLVDELFAWVRANGPSSRATTKSKAMDYMVKRIDAFTPSSTTAARPV